MQSDSTISSAERTCGHCGKLFTASRSQIRKSGGKFCSKWCSNHSHVLKSPVDRFWKHVTKTETCWLWTSKANNQGYGVLNVGDGQLVRANRFSYELHVGPIPDGLVVCHNCTGGDNRACVNPAHFFLGTRGDNIQDAAKKGTMPRGESSYNAKLTEQDVRDIRSQRAQGVPIAELANRYGIVSAHVQRIERRERWAHVD